MEIRPFLEIILPDKTNTYYIFAPSIAERRPFRHGENAEDMA